MSNDSNQKGHKDETCATLKEQKQLARYIRGFINKNGNPYDQVTFDFDHHQQRDCLSWLNFIGCLNDLEESNEKEERLDIKHIDAMRKVADKYFAAYYSPDFFASHKPVER